MEKKKSKLKFKLTRRRVIVLIIAALLLLLLLVGIVNLFKLIFAKEKSVGNLANMGLVVENGNTLFYNKYEDGIVKVKGNKEYQITDETAYSMTVYNDEIYYLTVSSTNTIELKKVKDNGDGLTNIKTLNTTISKFYIKDDYLYYATTNTVNGISKLSLADKTEKTILASSIQDFVLEGDKIYYVDNQGILYSSDLEGSDIEELTKDYNIKKIQVMKKWIYFYDDAENALCKIKVDGSNKKTVATFVNNEMYNVTSKKIYYYDQVNKQICKCDLKGKKSTPIVTIEATRPRISIADGTLYYLDNSKDNTQIYQMFRVKTNGNAAKSIDY